MMYCKFCGNELDTSHKFCQKCGKVSDKYEEKSIITQEDLIEAKAQKKAKILVVLIIILAISIYLFCTLYFSRMGKAERALKEVFPSENKYEIESVFGYPNAYTYTAQGHVVIAGKQSSFYAEFREDDFTASVIGLVVNIDDLPIDFFRNGKQVIFLSNDKLVGISTDW